LFARARFGLPLPESHLRGFEGIGHAAQAIWAIFS